MSPTRAALTLATSLFISHGIRSQEAAAPPNDALRRSAMAAMEATQQSQDIPALSVAVATGGQLQMACALGSADLENRVPATTRTRFRTASIAKPMTAVTVLQLAERKKLDLDAPISKIVTEFPSKRWPVTARQLLGHLGGVRHYARPGEANGTRHYEGVAAALEPFRDDPLLHEPGTRFGYTTYGYSLLGRGVEVAAGQPFVVYLQENVWKPAGMEHTTLDHTYQLISDRARGYQKLTPGAWARLPAWQKSLVKPGAILNAELHDTSMKVPGGGLLSTPSDLVRFALALQSGRLLKEETRQLMWTPQRTVSGQETGYGLGWGISGEGETWQIAHSGGQAGTSCFLVLRPRRQIVVAIMTNLRAANLRPLAQKLVETACASR